MPRRASNLKLSLACHDNSNNNNNNNNTTTTLSGSERRVAPLRGKLAARKFSKLNARAARRARNCAQSTSKQTNKQTHRQTDTQTDRLVERVLARASVFVYHYELQIPQAFSASGNTADN